MLYENEQKVMDLVFGSKLYGTNTETSDTDIKGIHIPSTRDILLSKPRNNISSNTSDKHAKNTSEDVDYQSYSLLQFIEMGIKGETIVLDMIHAEDVNVNNVNPEYQYVWDFIRENRAKFYTVNMKAYMGYVNKQAAIYGIKGSRIANLREVIHVVESLNLNEFLRFKDVINLLPELTYCKHFTDQNGNLYYEVLGVKYQSTIYMNNFYRGILKQLDKYGHRALEAEKNNGIDWKSLHHALRAGFQLLEIYKTNDLKYPLHKKDFLIKVKKGEIEFNRVKATLEYVIDLVDSAAKENKFKLPLEVNKEFWYNFVHRVYLSEIANE